MQNRKTPFQSSRLRSLVLTGLTGLSLLAGLSGCEGPEVIAYRSDVNTPKTVTLLDVITGEKLLTVEIPVGQQLNLHFEKEGQIAERDGRDTLRWSIKPWGDTSVAGDGASKMDVPPPSLRRLDVNLRPAPEQRPLGSR